MAHKRSCKCLMFIKQPSSNIEIPRTIPPDARCCAPSSLYTKWAGIGKSALFHTKQGTFVILLKSFQDVSHVATRTICHFDFVATRTSASPLLRQGHSLKNGCSSSQKYFTTQNLFGNPIFYRARGEISHPKASNF